MHRPFLAEITKNRGFVVRFESRENRLMWIGQGVSLITDLGVSIAIVFVIAELIDMGVSIPVVDLFAGLGVATILIVFVGARDVITNMLIFRLYQREYLTDLFRDGVTVVAKEGVPTSVTLDRP
jgi:hypothetical protein